MKRRTITIGLIIGATILNIILVSVVNKGIIALEKKIDLKKSLSGLTIPKSAVFLEEIDRHCENGDGEYFAKIQLSEEDKLHFMELINENESWKNMPLPIELVNRSSSDNTNNNNMNTENRTEFIGIYDSEIKLTATPNGKFFYKDRYNTSNLSQEKKDYTANNFTLSILDSENNILYIYKFDS